MCALCKAAMPPKRGPTKEAAPAARKAAPAAKRAAKGPKAARRLVVGARDAAPAAALGGARGPVPVAAPGPAFLLLVHSPACPHCLMMRPAWEAAAAQLLARPDGPGVVELETDALQRCAPGQSALADAVRRDAAFQGVPFIALADARTGAVLASHEGARDPAALLAFAASSAARRA